VLALLAACSEERTLQVTRLPITCDDSIRMRVTQVVFGAEGDFAPVLVSQPPDTPLSLTSLPQDARVLTVTGTIGGQPALIGRTGILALASAPAQVAVAYGPPGGFCAVGLMHAARMNPAAVRLSDGRVLVAGGGDPSVEIYDPSTAAWGSYTRYDLGLAQVTAVATDDDRVLLIGDGQAQFVDGAGHLERPALFLGGVRNAAAAKLADGRIFVSGTQTSAIYDPNVGAFTSGPATLMRSGGTAFVLADGRVLLAGGGNDVEILDLHGPGPGITLGGTSPPIAWAQLATGTIVGFSAGGDIAILPEEMQVLPLTSHSTATSATVLSDDLVLLLGGAPGVFVPSSGTTITMSTDASGAAAALLDDGTVLVAGGSSNAAQLYFHSTVNEFSTLKVMTFDDDEPGLIPRVLGSVAQRSGGAYHLQQSDYALLGGVRFAGVTVRASFEGDLDVLVGWLSPLESFTVRFTPNAPVALLHNGTQVCAGGTTPDGGFVSVDARSGHVVAQDAAGLKLLDCAADLPARFAVGVGGQNATVDDIEATR
jgi:hypothetical protein